MLRITLCLASVAVLACGLRADEKPPRPKDPPLASGTAKLQGENLLCDVVRTVYRTETRPVTVMKDGMLVTETRTVMVPVQFTERRLIALKGLRAYVTGGEGADPTKQLQELDATKLPEVLNSGPRVLFALDGQKVEPAQVKGEKKGTVVLVVPRLKPERTPPVAPKKRT
jgi:hypothetical protein